MNKTKRIAFGIGIVLAALVVLTTSAVADNVMRLEPSDIGCGQGEEVTDVWVYLNATDHVTGFQFHLKYEDDVVDIVNITSAVEGTNPDWLMWNPYWKVDSTTGHHYLFVTGTLLMSDVTGDNIELAKITLKGLSPGTRPLEFDGSYGGHDPCEICDIDANVLPLSVVNGTFTCGGAACPAPGNTVITSSCELTQDYIVPAGQAGYIIGSDDIVIEGNGHKITGTTTPANCEWGGEASPCAVSGIFNEGYDNVVINNLKIEGFCTGVALAGSGASKVRNNIIDNCEIHDNGFNTMSSSSEMVTHGIHACWIDVGDAGEPALTITGNDIYNNEGTGAACGDGGNGIFIYAGSPDAKHEKCDISYNHLYDNAKSGFWTKMMLTQSNITHNEVWGNGNGIGVNDDVRGGIVLRCKKSSENIIEYNHVYDNHLAGSCGYGIYVGGGDNLIRYNNVTGNSKHGISMARSDGSFNNELYENTVCDNGEHDISTCGAACSGNTGNENTCGNCNNYHDEGETCCTYPCGGEQPYYCDSDYDGYFNVTPSGYGTDLPAPPPECRWEIGDDCNDANPDVNPGVAENCTDGIDNDCDGLIDGADSDCLSNKVFFEPEDIRLPKYGDTTNVSIWIDAEDAITSGQLIFDYTNCCMNVTDFQFNDTNWNVPPSGWAWSPGQVKIIPVNLNQGGVGPGRVHVGDLTVNCCNDTGYCFTGLNWDIDPENSYLFNAVPEKIPINWQDGTFRCNIPDLVLTNVRGVETDAAHYTVSYTVKNIGEVNAGASHANLSVDGTQVETMPVPALGPGEEQTYSFASEIELIDDYDLLKVCADYNDAVVELDETNNCMVARYPGEVVISVVPWDTFVQPQDQFDVMIHVNPKGMPVYAVQYSLNYGTDVVRAETQTKGPFLGTIGETIVIVNNIDQPNGEVSYAETRKVSGGADVEDNVSTIHFIAIGPRSATTSLHLYDVIISDENGNRMAYIIEDGSVEITENQAPVANGTSKHRINNVAKKYQSTALLCSCSTDPDWPGKGGNITYIRWAFGDGQYGTSEGLPLNNCTCKEHKYESWLWENGDYVPFNAILTVTDDGCPELSNSTAFDVTVYIAGDANGDGEVDVLDAVWVGKHWRAECGTDPCDSCNDYLWDDAQADGADLNNDCAIDVLDAVIIGANWRHVAW